MNCFLGRVVFINLYFVLYVRAVLVFGSAEVVDTGNYSCVADQVSQTVLFIVTPGHLMLIIIIIFIIVVVIIIIIYVFIIKRM